MADATMASGRTATQYGLARLVAPRTTSTSSAVSHFVLGTDTSGDDAYRSTMSKDYAPLRPAPREVHGPQHRSTDHAHGDRSKISDLVSVTELSYQPHALPSDGTRGGDGSGLRQTHFKMHSDSRFASYATTNSLYYTPIDLSARDTHVHNLHASSIPLGDRDHWDGRSTTARDAFVGHAGAPPTEHVRRPPDARGVVDPRFGAEDRFVTSATRAFGDAGTAYAAARLRQPPVPPKPDAGVVNGDRERFGAQVSVTESSFVRPSPMEPNRPASHLRQSHIRLAANRHDWPASTTNESFGAPPVQAVDFASRPFNQSFVPTGDVRVNGAVSTTTMSSFRAPEGHERARPILQREDGVVFGRPGEGAPYETTARTSFGAYTAARPERRNPQRKTAIAFGESSPGASTSASDFVQPVGGHRPPLGDGNLDRLCGTHFDFGRDKHFHYYATTTGDAFVPYGRVERVQPVNPALQTHSQR